MEMVVSKVKKVPPAIWILVVLVVIFSITADNYLSIGNLNTILMQLAPLLVCALGQTFVVLTQGTDLSIGSSISMVTVLWMVCLISGMNVWAGMVVAVLAAVAAGMVNGVVVAFGKIPPFIATLGMQYILRSVALVASNSSSLYAESSVITYLGRGTIAGLPSSIWIAVVCFLLSWFLLYRTRFGSHIFAVGGNSEALTFAGGNVKKTTVMAYAFSGLTTGIAGLLMAGRIQSGNPIVGVGWEFNALAAVLLGGTSLREGRGSLVGTIFGVFLIQVLKSGLNSAGVPSIMQNAIIGVVIILAIIFDAYAKRSKEEGE